MARRRQGGTRRAERGFTLVEVCVALGMSLVLFSFTILPLRQMIADYRLAADARAIASQLALAKMQAAAEFTQAELVVNLAANTMQIEVYDKASGEFAASGGAYTLSEGDAFSVGGVTSPAGDQTTLAQTPAITFNSRGVPIDTTGTPTANDALYLIDTNGSCWAVTVSAAGQIGVWQYSGGSWIAR